MKIVKPFADQPLWEFYDVDIPDIDYSKYNFKTQAELSNLNVLAGDNFNKRMKVQGTSLRNERDLTYEMLVSEIVKVLLEIKAQNQGKNGDGDNEVSRHDENGNQFLLYCVDAWNIEKHCVPDLIIDKEGFFMGYHYDNRNIKANLFLNLEDNESSTEFIITNELTPSNFDDFVPTKKYYKGPTNKGSGYFYFNTNQLWHRIEVTEAERKIAMLGIVIQ